MVTPHLQGRLCRSASPRRTRPYLRGRTILARIGDSTPSSLDGKSRFSRKWRLRGTNAELQLHWDSVGRSADENLPFATRRENFVTRCMRFVTRRMRFVTRRVSEESLGNLRRSVPRLRVGLRLLYLPLAETNQEMVDSSNAMITLDQLPQLFEAYRPRLRTLVEVRIDRRIQSRIDASDIVQEAFTDAVRRFPNYLKEQKLSPYIWLRFLTLQQLVNAHRKHLGVKARTATQEQQMEQAGLESSAMACCLVGGESTPSAIVARSEEIARLTAALDEMEPLDREVLALRHFEQLEHAEIADLLGMTTAAVSSRYRRALRRIGRAINSDDHGEN
jgi:RNA polymerase sigma-70 factor, ECF subfamily